MKRRDSPEEIGEEIGDGARFLGNVGEKNQNIRLRSQLHYETMFAFFAPSLR